MILNVSTAILITKVRIDPSFKASFIEWQASLNTEIVKAEGFVSLEFVQTNEKQHMVWTITQQFCDREALESWRSSKTYQNVLKELYPFLGTHSKEGFEELVLDSSSLKGGVTEIFVTKVDKDREIEYRRWVAKMHRVEAKFPGFRGMYLHAPQENQENYWITLLQFDSRENLDAWINSMERQQALEEVKPLVTSLEKHRVISPYGGWFNSLEEKGEGPSSWKQTMLVLLVLFPIVMVESRLLIPYLRGLDQAVSTFIGNALSVALIAWPMMPIAIFLLGWWLKSADRRVIAGGVILLLFFYLAEIALFSIW